MKYQRFTPAPISFLKLRKSKLLKGVSVLMAFSFVSTMLWPNQAMALTSGPSQPEVMSFEPVETNQMVDLFTGDFTYNIPLFNLPGPNGGYPFNMAYHSGVTMDQEASWVGLGWNLNPGAINRNMRGLPDDFDGDDVKTTVDMKPNKTFGLGTGFGVEALGADPGASAQFGLSLYHNNYKGIGYSLDQSFGVTLDNDISLGFSGTLDSEEGVGVNASISMKHRKKDAKRRYQLGIGFNTSRGTHLSISGSRQKTFNSSGQDNNNESETDEKEGVTRNRGGSASLTFAENNFAPVISNPADMNHLSVNFKVGPAAGGAFTFLNPHGFFNVTNLKNKGIQTTQNAYGYANLQNAGASDMRDFSRYKDGVVNKSSTNIGIPSLSYDVYAVRGQGVGGMYRPFRADVGAIYDPEATSHTRGGSIGVEVGIVSHWGVNATLTYGESTVGAWDQQNEWYDHYKFVDNVSGKVAFEPVHYKMAGEPTTYYSNELAHIFENVPVRAKLEKQGVAATKRWVPQKEEFVANGSEIANTSFKNYRSSVNRVPRNTVIQPIKNEQISEFSQPNYKAKFGEFEIRYYQMPTTGSGAPDTANFPVYTSDPTNSVERASINGSPIDHHHGGVIVTNTSGLRYVYGIPAYNKKHIDALFSVDDSEGQSCGPHVEIPVNSDTTELAYKVEGTDEFLSKTETPPYAHSFLLTSLLGNDYVDIDGDGPSDEDFGYWVKFDYIKYADDYKWRAPFKGANYSGGLKTTAQDNRGSYMYGEKEAWYIARAETKTHIAIFHTSQRDDNFEAEKELNVLSSQVNGRGDFSGLKLDSISVYLKDDFRADGYNAKPIQRVHMRYSYDLCQNAQNSAADSTGKLTLTKLWVTSEDNSRSALSPYTFDYHEDVAAENPDYSLNNYDRWGNFKPSGVDDCENREFPYVEQFDYDDGEITVADDSTYQSLKDQNVSVWSLKEIQLPTGGIINISYEADDYSHVQHQQAMQMTPITEVNDDSNGDDLLYDGSWDETLDDQRRVHFKLEEPIRNDAFAHQKLFDRYLRNLKRGEDYLMYFNIYVDLRDQVYEDYVQGWCVLDMASGNYGATNLQTFDRGDGAGSQQYYTEGYVTVKLTEIDGNPVNYHPFSVAAWQYMRTTNPDMLNTPGNLADDPGGSNIDKANKVMSLFSWIPDLIQTFSGYRAYCENHEWARRIDLSKSYIRLCSPDKKKYGGGCRVKQITFNDSWNTASGEQNSEYGQVYDYTTVEDGQTISSGVAHFEPMIGGDENALRYAKLYHQSIPFKTDNHLFFEHPVNENYFPSPTVGYRQVTVRSLTANKVITGELSSNVSSTGEVVHEFYTAKDFPTIVSETDIAKKKKNFWYPMPLIGSITLRSFTASQGYAIELNDMHGKPKAVRNYALDKDGERVPQEVSSVRYFYKNNYRSYQDKQVRQLDNQVDVIVDNLDETSSTNDATFDTRLLGLEYEFFTDQRHKRDWSLTAGLMFNVDLVTPPTPVPTIWPSFVYTDNNLRTVTTNKIIHRTGILEKVVATDGQSTVTTTNKLWDAQTGQVLLSTVNNNYDNPIYNFNHPAHWEYAEVGPGYTNTGYVFSTTAAATTNNGDSTYSIVLSASDLAMLHAGDELLFRNPSTSEQTKTTYLGENNSGHGVFYCIDDIKVDGTMFITRSGKRNHLSASVGSITALADPTRNRTKDSCDHPQPKVEGYYDYYTIDSVLAISAISMNDGFFKDASQTRSDSVDWWTDFDHNNPYAKGEKGVWYPQNSYHYYDDRQQTASIDLSIDGIMDSVAMFDYQLGWTPQCISKWKKVNEITNYSAYGYETEEKNILGIYSSALYGYGGAVSTAVAGNAREKEIGFDGFEQYAEGAAINQFDMATGNIDIYSNHSSASYTLYDYYEVLESDGYKITIDKEYDSVWSPPSSMTISAFSIPTNYGNASERVYDEVTISSQSQDGDYTQISFSGASADFWVNSTFYKGKVAIPRVVTQPSPATNDVEITDATAHTGEQSLMVTGTVTFEQNRLRLQPGEKYELSAWVSQNNTNVHSYNDSLYIQLNFIGPNGTHFSSTPIIDGTPTGEVIEGWQKIEFDFSVPDTADHIEIEINSKLIGGSNTDSYVDDLRIFPHDGNIKTFVYDTNFLRVTAELDARNFATLYYYDESGKLYLVKKETERGIFTLQESRSHLNEQ